MRLDLKKLDSRFTSDLKSNLKKFSKIAKDLNIQLYLVGGSVRDLILNYPSLDIDLLLDSKLDEFLKILKKDHLASAQWPSPTTAPRLVTGGTCLATPSSPDHR